ncbi:TMEM165/GDT1 family protein [Candidatus Woesearchaeota archaeon]|nr:TMEM165/GDT1 family protein [Candidatus Woesearchaeota archaeon]
MLADLLLPLAVIAIAEIGDKTQLAMMSMAARYGHTLQIFFGAMVASALVDGSAVVFGSYVARFIPVNVLLVASGLIFVAVGVFTLIRREEESVKMKGRKSVFLMAFSLFFVSEFGDKSQVAAFLFGANYNVFLAFLGAVAGIAIVLSLMLLIGKLIRRRLNEKIVRIASSLLFLILGVLTLAKALA